MLGEVSKGCGTIWGVLPGSDGCLGACASSGVVVSCISGGFPLLPWSPGQQGACPCEVAMGWERQRDKHE